MSFSDLARMAAIPIDGHSGEPTRLMPWSEGEHSEGFASGLPLDLSGIVTRGSPDIDLSKGARPGNAFGFPLHKSEVRISYALEALEGLIPKQGDRVLLLKDETLYRVADVVAQTMTHIILKLTRLQTLDS